MAICLKKAQEQDQIDKSTSWTTDKYVTSHFEGYAFAIHEQEINTKDLQYRRDIKSGKAPSQNNKCRLCDYCVKDITHDISSCSKMSSRYYLPLSHDVTVKTIYNEILRKENPVILSKISYAGLLAVVAFGLLVGTGFE